MSQFMLCNSLKNLGAYGKCLLEKDTENRELFVAVSEKYFHPLNMKNVWIVENISEYCDQALSGIAQTYEMQETHKQLYNLIDKLYDVSETMILWYGNDYKELDIVDTKEELIEYIAEKLKSYCFELYVWCKNVSSGRKCTG